MEITQHGEQDESDDFSDSIDTELVLVRRRGSDTDSSSFLVPKLPYMVLRFF